MSYFAKQRHLVYLIPTLITLIIVLIVTIFYFGQKSLAPSFWKTQMATKSAPKAPKPISFIAFGDSGVGSAEQKKLAELMKEEDFEFILHTGDVAYSNGSAAEIQANVLEIYKDLFATHPFYPSLGNHDYGTDHGKPYLETWDLPRQALNEPDQERYYSFDASNAHFVSLDTNIPLNQDDSATQTDMFDWLATDLALAQTRGSEWIVVYFHHPPFSSGTVHGEDNKVQEKLVPIFEKYGVDLVLSGHEHNYERTCPITLSTSGRVCTVAGKAPTYVVTGGGGNRLYGFAEQKPWYFGARASVHHYLQVDINGCRLDAEAINLSKEVIDSFNINKCS